MQSIRPDGCTMEPPRGGRIQRANSLADDVYEAIFAQLMSLKIAPGSRITVDSLVRNSTSRIPRSARRSAGSRAKAWW